MRMGEGSQLHVGSKASFRYRSQAYSLGRRVQVMKANLLVALFLLFLFLHLTLKTDNLELYDHVYPRFRFRPRRHTD
jgi:hypothetical protein